LANLAAERGRGRPGLRLRTAFIVISSAVVLFGVGTRSATPSPGDPCAAPVDVIACENSKLGTPRSEWDIAGAGDPSIQGYASEFSVVPGQTVDLKIKTDAASYRIEILRLGWYGGNGARKVATIQPSAALPQSQPACVNQASTGLVDCGNWSVSASWPVPDDAVSGVYIARLVRNDTGGDSHVVFVVRDDERHSDLLFQTADTTWQAYNRYGGNSLYFGSPANRAYKVSYNRPFTTRSGNNESWLFSSEYPMIRWLERNGFDVSYTTGIDTARRGAELLEHKAFLSVGHDEYWSGGQRANVEAARAAGVNLAFFSGNEVFWKTRWEPSIDGTSTDFKTLVCYKETSANAKVDPDPAWTGTWRDPRFSPPSDGGRAENALTGTLFTVNSYREDPINVPASFGALRFWRNTSIAGLTSGQATLPAGTLGHEWDEDVDNGVRPAGVVRLSSTTLNVDKKIQDFGSTYAPGTATHSLVLYRASSGALVFGSGTVQWPWGLDDVHDVINTANPPRPPDSRMQQATVNLFADMGAQPRTLQSDLVPATQSTDHTSPTSVVTSPAAGSTVSSGSSVTVTGTASDTGGQVGGVEVSTDEGATWHPASGTSTWSYTWAVTGSGPVHLRTRAVDDSGNIETPGPGVAVTVVCPCRLFAADAQPGTPASGDAGAVEVGVKFQSSQSGWITAIRFYKGSTNVGNHVVSLWNAAGTLLARAPVTGESASGWQEAQLDAPAQVSAGTTYVASYYAPSGHYALNLNFFGTAFTKAPLTALADGPSGGNGVYSYGPAPTFPNHSFSASNYWVDVVFSEVQPADTRPPSVASTTPTSGAVVTDTGADVVASFDEAVDPATVNASTVELRDASGALVPSAVRYDAPTRSAVLDPTSSLAFGASYTAKVRGGPTGVADVAGNRLAADFTWAFSTAALNGCPCSIYGAGPPPGSSTSTDTQAVEVGVKFRSDLPGFVSAVRFYKGAGNGGTHVGSLWSSTGTLLGRATFTGETATGWQTATFGGPVAIDPDKTYIASYYAPQGRYSLKVGAFSTADLANPPLRAIRDGLDGGNGVYRYGAAPQFPSQSFGASGYGVDVVFNTGAPADTQPPEVSGVTPAGGASSVSADIVPSATFSEQVDPTTVTAGSFTLVSAGGSPVAATVAYDSASRTAMLTPTAQLTLGASYTARIASGPTGVRDLAGNPLAADVSWQFTVRTCPCTIWSSSAQPGIPSSSDGGAVELGLRFRAEVPGWISGIRFYKGSGNGGTHVGSLWSNSGTLLARATFSGESSSGWQQVTFDAPVAVTAGTTYVASYYAPVGHYAVNLSAFTSAGVDASPLHALRDGVDGASGVYRYSSQPTFPNQTWQASNYWVDVVFETSQPGDTLPPSVASTTPARGATDVALNTTVAVTFSEPMDAASVNSSTIELRDGATSVAATVTYDSATATATLTPSAQLAYGRTYTVRVAGGLSGVRDASGNSPNADDTWTFVTRTCGCTIFSSTAQPAIVNSGDGASVELGVRFRADVAGTITGLRFYKGSANTGVHVGSLWSSNGTLLAQATFSGETASGWQQVTFASPVTVAAGTTYVASYHAPNGNYSVNLNGLQSEIANPPLRALQNGADGGNGVYLYGPNPAFPTQTYQGSNYWVDVVFSPSG
jgi:hypothetical protein